VGARRRSRGAGAGAFAEGRGAGRLSLSGQGARRARALGLARQDVRFEDRWRGLGGGGDARSGTFAEGRSGAAILYEGEADVCRGYDPSRRRDLRTGDESREIGVREEIGAVTT